MSSVIKKQVFMTRFIWPALLNPSLGRSAKLNKGEGKPLKEQNADYWGEKKHNCSSKPRSQWMCGRKVQCYIHKRRTIVVPNRKIIMQYNLMLKWRCCIRYWGKTNLYVSLSLKEEIVIIKAIFGLEFQ